MPPNNPIGDPPICETADNVVQEATVFVLRRGGISSGSRRILQAARMVGPIENFGEARLRNVLKGFAKGGGRLGPFRGLRLTTCRAVPSGEPRLGAISWPHDS